MKLVINKVINNPQKISSTLTDYLRYLKSVNDKKNFDDPESSINLPTDEELLNAVRLTKKEKLTPNLKYIIDIGIGGSNLGTKAVYDGLLGYFDIVSPNRFPKMVFADTNDPALLSKLRDLFVSIESKDEILINAISKSGTTTETTVNLEVILSFLDKFPDILSRLVVTTDKASKLWQAAEEKKVKVLNIPKQVGGRYSVLSAVGLFPLACVGLDIDSLREGAAEMVEKCLGDDSVAAQSAEMLYSCMKEGFVVNDNFFFCPQLESLGKWYRQLMGESLGKREDLGITPTISVGSTDLHSVGQLYLGGPKDKVTTFVWSELKEDVSVPESLTFPNLVSSIAGKSAQGVMSAILEGVKLAYKKRNLPFMEVVLDDLSEKSIGQFLQFKMIEIMLLGKLMNVNAFDQPNVEDYKIETKRILDETN